jgi:predicted PurR-regulated permease PerM
MTNLPQGTSPKWSWTTKLIVGLALVAFIGWLLIKFENFLGPLLVVFILAYVLYPLAKRVSSGLRIPWRLAVTLIYLILIVILAGLLTWGSLTLINQLQSLINFLQRELQILPSVFQTFSQQVYRIGPFEFNASQIDLNAILNQVLATVQPLLGRVGNLLGIIATSAATMLGWIGFIIVVSYFMLVESAGIPGGILRIQIPAYDEDIKRFGVELTRIWNAFLRGQIVVTGLSILVYAVMLDTFRLPFFLGLAFIGGFGRFIPYVGAYLMWLTYGLVAYFAVPPPFGLSPLFYAIMVVGCAILIDQIIDNFISPRIIARAVKVHPAAVMVAALIGLSLFGLIGMILAAPILATLNLFMNYIFRKMLDLDPWEGMKLSQDSPQPHLFKLFREKGYGLIKRIINGSSITFSRVWKRLVEKR